MNRKDLVRRKTKQSTNQVDIKECIDRYDSSIDKNNKVRGAFNKFPDFFFIVI